MLGLMLHLAKPLENEQQTIHILTVPLWPAVLSLVSNRSRCCLVTSFRKKNT